MTREIALDTETTGLEPADGHRIVEIGCVELIQGIRTGQHFHVYLNPERAMPVEAEAVHGLSEAFLADKPRFSEKADEFLAFIGDSPLVIHNAAFDMRFLNAELKRLGKPVLPVDRAVDTVGMARLRYPGQPASLDALCRRFEIDLSRRTKHGALLDAELLADVYLELNGGRQSNLILETVAEQAITIAETVVTAIPRRLFAATAEEKLLHLAFLQEIKEPLWLKLEASL